jgi:rubrerythrin
VEFDLGENMPAKIDFAKLTPADALDLGVLMEEEARQRYIDFAEMLEEVHHNHDAAAFCRAMVTTEERHGKQLWKQRHERYPDAPARVTADMLYDVEAPGQENPSAFMTARAAMLMALDAEKKAEAFFRGAIAGTLDAEVVTLFAELAEEEVDHQRMVREQLAKLPTEGPVRRDDIADEPVGQD